ncbi:MAG: hypothetical protein ACFFB0_05440 [Promethearchaeota archaeon]
MAPSENFYVEGEYNDKFLLLKYYPVPQFEGLLIGSTIILNKGVQKFKN